MEQMDGFSIVPISESSVNIVFDRTGYVSAGVRPFENGFKPWVNSFEAPSVMPVFSTVEEAVSEAVSMVNKYEVVVSEFIPAGKEGVAL